MIFKNLISKNRGFTLIEMLVVLAVLAILLGLVSPNISLIAERANQAVGNLNAKIFRGNAVYDLALNNKSNIRISETVDLSTVGEVDDVVVNYSGTDTLKMLVSTDRGNSWHSYTINDQASLKDMFGGYAKANGLKWGLIDHSRKENVRKRGLSVNGLNNIEKNTWLEMLEGKNSVTFGFNATDSEGEDVTWTTNPSLNIEVIGSNKTENVGFPKVDKSDLALRFKGLTDKTVDENTLFSYQLNATNPHDKELTYSIVNSGELPVGLSINSIGLIEWDIGYEDEGNYIVEVQVTDGNLSDTASFNLIVNDINRPPESLSVSDQTIIEGHNLNFSVGSSDPDGDILTYTSSNLPSGASLDSSTGVFDWTPSLSQAGSYEITINTSDGSTTTSDSFTITVNDNVLPTMSVISDKTITTDDTLNVTPSANDSQGEELTFTASDLPEEASFDISTGNISWSNPSEGSWNITVTTEDEVGQSTSETFKLIVEKNNLVTVNYNPEESFTIVNYLMPPTNSTSALTGITGTKTTEPTTDVKVSGNYSGDYVSLGNGFDIYDSQWKIKIYAVIDGIDYHITTENHKGKGSSTYSENISNLSNTNHNIKIKIVISSIDGNEPFGSTTLNWANINYEYME